MTPCPSLRFPGVSHSGPQQKLRNCQARILLRLLQDAMAGLWTPVSTEDRFYLLTVNFLVGHFFCAGIVEKTSKIE